jgi:predicted peptidase
MNKTLHFFLAAGVAALASCSTMKKAATSPQQPKPPIANISAKTFTQKLSLGYTLFLPQGYDANGKKKWPLLMFLHGSGEREGNLWRVTFHGPAKYIEQHADFPFILVSPQCPPGSKWSDDTLMGLLDEVIAKNRVDTNRVYLTGLSMGGYGTWSLATTYPERFAAVAPVCGGEGNIGIVLSLADPKKASALKRLPIWAFHGAKDNVVHVTESERMVALMKKAGNRNVKLTVYPEAMHNSWTQTYDQPELYEWFLQFRLNQK